MAGPTHAQTAKSGSRKYVDPTDSTKLYPSVTTILNALAKPALVGWAARLTAEYAVDNAASWRDLDRAAAVDLLKKAHRRKNELAMKLGSEVHAAAEAWMLDKPMPAWSDGVEPFMNNFVQWLEDFEPVFEMVEATVCSTRHGYAGTLDAIVKLPKVNDRRVVVDYKTGSGVYPEYALQLSAYRYADEVWLDNGTKLPLHANVGPIDGAAVLHLQPDGYSFVPVETGPEVFESFLAAKRAYEWADAIAPTVVRPPFRPAVPA